jgi:N-acetylglutamate synthase-like GNAT family acetyltransferase
MHILIPVRKANELHSKSLFGSRKYDSRRICSPTYVCKRIHDTDMKSKVVRLLSSSIPSIEKSLFESYILSELGRDRRIHTWGIYTCGRYPELVAAAVFRRHSHVSIIELMWIATDPSFRKEGFGTELITSLTNDWYDSGLCDYVLTFADISAVGFFERIGFQDSLPFPRDLWDPWIDKYSRSRMLCLPLRKIDFFKNRVERSKPVAILVYVDNIESFTPQIWVNGVVLVDSNTVVLVQYSYLQKTYQEVLSRGSHRLREIC